MHAIAWVVGHSKLIHDFTIYHSNLLVCLGAVIGAVTVAFSHAWNWKHNTMEPLGIPQSLTPLDNSLGTIAAFFHLVYHVSSDDSDVCQVEVDLLPITLQDNTFPQQDQPCEHRSKKSSMRVLLHKTIKMGQRRGMEQLQNNRIPFVNYYLFPLLFIVLNELCSALLLVAS